MMDLLISGFRVLRETLLVLGDGAINRNNRRIPLRPASITAEWLTDILQAYAPGVRVASVRHLGKVFGTTTHIRIGLQYNAVGQEAELPGMMYLKLAPREMATRVFISLFNLGRHETRFYNQVAEEIADLVPRAYYSVASGKSARFALLMDDLTFNDDQIKDITHNCSPDEAKSVMKSLAAVHSRFWDSPRFESDLAWLLTYRTDPNIRLNRLMRRWALKKTLDKYRDIIAEPVKENGGYINKRYDDLERYWARPPLTLIHGDPHIGNMYFCSGRAGLLDWQVVRRGQGMRDVAYFLVSSLPTEERQAHQQELIGLYLDCLQQAGVTAPSFDQAWEQYQLHTFYTWIAQIVTAAAGTLQQESIVRTGLTRTAKAIVDLDCLGVLRAMPRM